MYCTDNDSNRCILQYIKKTSAYLHGFYDTITVFVIAEIMRTCVYAMWMQICM